MKRSHHYVLLVFTGGILLLPGCHKEDGSLVSQNKIIALTITSDTAGLKADGQETISLQAVLPADAMDAYRNVTFSASASLGNFSGSTASSNIVAVNSNGVATTTLTVGTTPGSYYVSAQTGSGSSLYKTPDILITLYPLTFADKLKLSADNPQPVADNQTIVNISVASKYETARTITLTANLGSFLQSTTPTQYVLNLDGNGNGTTQFQVSNQVQPHVITATFADGTTTSITLTPQPSLPDKIIADPSSLVIDPAGGPVTFKVLLSKNNPNAKVSVNTPAGFTAYQLIGGVQKQVGRFTGLGTALSDAGGNINGVSFYGDTGDLDVTQPVFIIVTSPPASPYTVKLKVKS